ncbi:MAG TPA: hypothetical protein VGF30_11855 [Bacteroidia bacterium]
MKLFVKFLVPVVLTALIFSACKDEESLKEKEIKKMKEQLASTKVDFYKSVKVTVRSTAAMPKDPEFAEARKAMISLATGLFQYQVDADGKVLLDSTKMTPMDIVTMIKTFYSAKDILLKTDEDSLPTIVENVLYVLSGGKSSSLNSFGYFKSYNANYEHAILGATWTASHVAPKEFALYEFYKTDEDQISDKEMMVVVKIAKSLIFLNNEYYYHSKEKADQYLETVEANKDYFIKNPFMTIFPEAANITPEMQYYQLHCLGYVMRALAEEKMDMMDECDEDMEKFVEEAEKGGGDNELIWMVGAYNNIKKEDKEKALVYLNKLEKSDKIGDPEKQAVTDIKKYMEDRDPDKALTKFKDKFALISISYDLLKARMAETKQIQEFKKSKEGDKFFGIQKTIDEKSEMLNSMSGGADSLTSKAGSFVKNLFGK